MERRWEDDVEKDERDYRVDERLEDILKKSLRWTRLIIFENLECHFEINLIYKFFHSIFITKTFFKTSNFVSLGDFSSYDKKIFMKLIKIIH